MCSSFLCTPAPQSGIFLRKAVGGPSTHPGCPHGERGLICPLFGFQFCAKILSTLRAGKKKLITANLPVAGTHKTPTLGVPSSGGCPMGSHPFPTRGPTLKTSLAPVRRGGERGSGDSTGGPGWLLGLQEADGRGGQQQHHRRGAEAEGAEVALLRGGRKVRNARLRARKAVLGDNLGTLVFDGPKRCISYTHKHTHVHTCMHEKHTPNRTKARGMPHLPRLQK